MVSGGHSHIVKVNSYTELETVGKTTDDAAGEAFDKAARAMGFQYPGGVHIDRAAKQGDAKKYKAAKTCDQKSGTISAFPDLKPLLSTLYTTTNKRALKLM